MYFELGSKLRIKMEDNAFPFGAKFGADQYETIEEEWKYYFNYGEGLSSVAISVTTCLKDHPLKDIVPMK